MAAIGRWELLLAFVQDGQIQGGIFVNLPIEESTIIRNPTENHDNMQWFSGT